LVKGSLILKTFILAEIVTVRRVRFTKSRNSPPLSYTGQHKTDPVSMQLFVYNTQGVEEYKDVGLQKIRQELDDHDRSENVLWLNIHGLHDLELMRELGKILKLEEFVLVDILNIQRRSRMEQQNEVLFFSIKSVLEEDPDDSLMIEQISFVMRKNVLVSFQEKRSDFFTGIRKRIREDKGAVRKKKSDYLLYLLMDAVMDNFYITLENYEDKIEAVIAEAKTSYRLPVLERIEKLRENLNFLRRSIVPLRDALYNLKSMQSENDYSGIESTHYIYFNRLHQKTLEMLEQTDFDKNALESASNFFFSSQNQRMNQIMKTLTMVSVIFIPLTFIVGVYGMNFKYMPELENPKGYLAVWIIMFAIAVLMLLYFRKKRWF
jgi:magnesium transporter